MTSAAASFGERRALGEEKRDTSKKRVAVTGGSGKLGECVWLMSVVGGERSKREESLSLIPSCATVCHSACLSATFPLPSLGCLPGRSVVEYLANEGWEVINLDRRRPAGVSEDGKVCRVVHVTYRAKVSLPGDQAYVALVFTSPVPQPTGSSRST